VHPNIVNQITGLMQQGYAQWACIQTTHAESDRPDRLKLQVSAVLVVRIHMTKVVATDGKCFVATVFAACSTVSINMHPAVTRYVLK
jgi:hypothetical protein